MQTMKIGVVGCGNISPAYFKGCREYENIEAVACADLDQEAARKRVEEFGIPKTEVDAVPAEVESTMAEIVRFALDSPWPSPDEVTDDIFA